MRKREQHMMLIFFDNRHMARILPIPQVPKMDRELARLLNLQENKKKQIETLANIMLIKTLTPRSNLLRVHQVMEVRRNIILLKDLKAILQRVTSILMVMQTVRIKAETLLVQSILHLDHIPILNMVQVHLHLAKAPIPVNPNQIQVATAVNTVSQGIVVARATSIPMEMQTVRIKVDTLPVQSILHMGHIPILNTATMYLHLVKAPIPVNPNQIQVVTVVNTVNKQIVEAQVELADLHQEVEFTESARTGCLASAV